MDNKSVTRKTPPRKRRLEAFRPCGPVAAMIDNEIRSPKYGGKTRLFEDAIVALLRSKYPKLAERFQMLREEAERN